MPPCRTPVVEVNVEQFKQLLLAKYVGVHNPEQHDDLLLARFIKAGHGNLLQAAQTFARCEKWRNENDINGIHEYVFQEKSKVLDIIPNAFHKTDKKGRMIWIKRTYKFDIQVLRQHSTEERIMQFQIREKEKNKEYRSKACSIKKGADLAECLLIIDLTDMAITLMQMYSLVNLIQKFSTIDNDFYPGSVGNVMIVNAGYLFSSIWSTLKPVLPAEIAAKVSILGTNYQDKIFDLVDKENLPTFLGGTCECEGGCEKADVGPWNDGSVPGFPNAKWEMEF